MYNKEKIWLRLLLIEGKLLMEFTLTYTVVANLFDKGDLSVNF